MTAVVLRKYTPIVVPSWIVKQLERAKMPAETLLDLTEMLKVCSLEDVVILYCLNSSFTYKERIFGPGQSVNSQLILHWQRHHSAALDSVLELVPVYETEVSERVFFTDSASHHQLPHMVPIESNDASLHAIVIIIQPGHFGGEDQRKAQHCLVREYMRQLYAFTDYAVLARDSLFERYLKCVTLNDVSQPA